MNAARTPARLPQLTLSLQFGRFDGASALRSVLTRAGVTRSIRHALMRDAEITVRIVDEAEGLSLNEGFRQQDHATNVLTFDYAHEPVVMADLVLCAPVIVREAQEQGKDLLAHCTHLLVHGTLHAQGFDHLNDEEAETMEAREIEVLAGLGFANPYAP